MSQPFYDFHVFICQNKRPDGHLRGCCVSKGAEKLANYMKARAKELGIARTRINKSGCLDQCEQDVALVIYPKGVWYSVHTVAQIETIIQQHILGGQVVKELMMDKDNAKELGHINA